MKVLHRLDRVLARMKQPVLDTGVSHLYILESTTSKNSIMNCFPLDSISGLTTDLSTDRICLFKNDAWNSCHSRESLHKVISMTPVFLTNSNFAPLSLVGVYAKTSLEDARTSEVDNQHHNHVPSDVEN